MIFRIHVLLIEGKTTSNDYTKMYGRFSDITFIEKMQLHIRKFRKKSKILVRACYHGEEEVDGKKKDTFSRDTKT